MARGDVARSVRVMSATLLFVDGRDEAAVVARCQVYIATWLQNSRDPSPLHHRYHVPAVSSLVLFNSADHPGPCSLPYPWLFPLARDGVCLPLPARCSARRARSWRAKSYLQSRKVHEQQYRETEPNVGKRANFWAIKGLEECSRSQNNIYGQETGPISKVSLYDDIRTKFRR